ncbi:hypothetical protein G6F35_018355 [Rhizopus arrhizus]|nr:hypothetical protein G6F35_018355 [Rhizopus arrhizus]
MGSMDDEDEEEQMPGMSQEEPAVSDTPVAGLMQDFSLDTVSSMLDDMGYTRPAPGIPVQRLHREVPGPGRDGHVQDQEADVPESHQHVEPGIPLDPCLPGRQEPG